jgi:DNA-binding response OmpR family regulator
VNDSIASKQNALIANARKIVEETDNLIWSNTLKYDENKAVNNIRNLAKDQLALLSAPAHISCGNITIDTTTKTCKVNGKTVPLTRLELTLLMPLVQADGRIVPYDQIAIQSDISMRSHAKNTRKKLKDAGANKNIRAQHAIGYFLQDV